MLEFWKYHGLGNDFLVVEGSRMTDSILSQVVSICDRHTGVGADGILIVDPTIPSMIVYNSDGSRPQMCGNGVRCVARFLWEEHGQGDVMTIETDAGPRRCIVECLGPEVWVDVDMGEAAAEAPRNVFLDDAVLTDVTSVSVGNPHAVYFGSMTIAEVERVGSAMNAGHPDFPEGVNFECVNVRDTVLEVVVYERGVGRTQACGTGACAVAVAAWSMGIRKPGPTQVRLPGGTLTIDIRGKRTWMRGPAEAVYRGSLGNSWFKARVSEADKEVNS